MSKLAIVRNVLGAAYNAAHYNHLHVDVNPRATGTPPGKFTITDSVRELYGLLEERFGRGDYFTQATKDTKWTHMGIYNHRKIAGSSTWSQHAYGNAIDIGPYYGIEEQKPFYDFLMGIEEKEADMPRDVGEREGVDTMFAQVWQEMLAEGVFSQHTDPDATPRNEQLAAFLSRYTRAVVADEIQKALGAGDVELELEGKRLVIYVEDVK